MKTIDSSLKKKGGGEKIRRRDKPLFSLRDELLSPRGLRVLSLSSRSLQTISKLESSREPILKIDDDITRAVFRPK